jgi:hypothetical protein
MARAIKEIDMSEDERRSWRRWYTEPNFRSVLLSLHQGKPFTFSLPANGERVIFHITPPKRESLASAKYVKYHCDRCFQLVDIRALRRNACIIYDAFGGAIASVEYLCVNEPSCDAWRRRRDAEAASRRRVEYAARGDHP